MVVRESILTSFTSGGFDRELLVGKGRAMANRIDPDVLEILKSVECEVVELPEGAFKSSGTGVQSIYVVVDKPSDD